MLSSQPPSKPKAVPQDTLCSMITKNEQLYQRLVQETRQTLALYDQDKLLFVQEKSHIEELACPLQLLEDQKTNGCLLVIKNHILRMVLWTSKRPRAKTVRSWRKPVSSTLPDLIAFMETLHPGAAVKDGSCFAPDYQDLQTLWKAGGTMCMWSTRFRQSKARRWCWTALCKPAYIMWRSGAKSCPPSCRMALTSERRGRWLALGLLLDKKKDGYNKRLL